MLSTELTIPYANRTREIGVITDQLREIVIEAATKMLLDPRYEFSEQEEIAISILLVEQFEMQELWSADIGQKTMH